MPVPDDKFPAWPEMARKGHPPSAAVSRQRDKRAAMIAFQSSVTRAGRTQTQVERIIQNRNLRLSQVQRRLLTYLVEKSLAGEADDLKEYTIGVDAFGKPPSYDPRQESRSADACRAPAPEAGGVLPDGRSHGSGSPGPSQGRLQNGFQSASAGGGRCQTRSRAGRHRGAKPVVTKFHGGCGPDSGARCGDCWGQPLADSPHGFGSAIKLASRTARVVGAAADCGAAVGGVY